MKNGKNKTEENNIMGTSCLGGGKMLFSVEVRKNEAVFSGFAPSFFPSSLPALNAAGGRTAAAGGLR